MPKHLTCRLLFQKEFGRQLETINAAVDYAGEEAFEYIEWLENKVENLSNGKN